MLATSLSLVVIFVPVAFMGGIVGRFFRSFGLTVAFAVLMSLFVSFTLTPMLCAYFLKLDPDEAGQGQIEIGLDLSADRRQSTAGCSAGRCRHRWSLVVVCLLSSLRRCRWR